MLEDLLLSRCRNPCDNSPSESVCECEVPCRAPAVIFWLDVSKVDFDVYGAWFATRLCSFPRAIAFHTFAPLKALPCV
jgi:hypothetical protein